MMESWPSECRPRFGTRRRRWRRVRRPEATRERRHEARYRGSAGGAGTGPMGPGPGRRWLDSCNPLDWDLAPVAAGLGPIFWDALRSAKADFDGKYQQHDLEGFLEWRNEEDGHRLVRCAITAVM